MKRVAILSDTHIPSRESEIPDWVEDHLESADHVLHAGDFDSPDAYERVKELTAGTLTAVAGNVDPASLGLPSVATVDVEGVRFVLTHGTGDPSTYEQRIADTVHRNADAADTFVGVSGHTHELLDTTVDGVRLLNPGSATGAQPASGTTMYVARVDGGSIDVELLER